MKKIAFRKDGFHIKLTDDLIARIDRECARSVQSRSALIRYAITDYLDNHTGNNRGASPSFLDTFTEEDKAALVSAPAPADVPEEERARLEGDKELWMLFQDGRRLPAIRSKGKCQACGAGDGEFHADGCRNELCPKCKRKLDDCEHTMIERYVYKG